MQKFKELSKDRKGQVVRETSAFKELAKDRWNSGKGETTLRGQVGAVLGRKGNQQHAAHDATPISQLRDPSTFAPPPKRVDSGGLLPPPALPSSSSRPVSPAGPYENAQQEHGVVEEASAPKPYRVDTTGLSTANIPPPPKRNDGTDGRTLTAPPPPYTPYTPSVSAAASGKPPPSLPPRLPPRMNSASPGALPGASPRLPVPEAPSRQTGFLNQAAVDRLGATGVSVPGLGIGGGSKPVFRPPPRSSGSSPPPASGSGVNELQSRFSKLGGLGGSATSSQSPPPSQGTTWAQKQAALKTMSDFKKNPNSVSLADARNAASTANNFRQRHGEQVAAGVKTANSLDQKYGLSGKKRPPPPPPPKRKADVGTGSDCARGNEAPPPIPMSTRPL